MLGVHAEDAGSSNLKWAELRGVTVTARAALSNATRKVTPTVNKNPGEAQQNGRHERMHLTRKKDATRPAGANILQQQEKFDAFIEEFNNERPHEALDMKCPAEISTVSARSDNSKMVRRRGLGHTCTFVFANATGPARDRRLFAI